jgi:periplasmic protein TonB
VLHVGAVVALVLFTARPPAASPPMYKVNIVAAPPGVQAPGIVAPTPVPAAPPLKTLPPAREVAPKTATAPVPKAAPRPTPLRATPTPAPPKTAPPPPAAALPKAGGGPTGDVGADVATVRTEGIEFPFPAYLNNIVRQVALNFSPDNGSQLRAEVAFLIRRDGTVAGFRFVTRSGDYAFDLEAQGAIEKAARAFGPLPDGFNDDVLPIVFSFDPRILH